MQVAFQSKFIRHLAIMYLKHPLERCLCHPENRIVLIPISSPRWCFAFPTSSCKTAEVLMFTRLRAMPHAEVPRQSSEEI